MVQRIALGITLVFAMLQMTDLYAAESALQLASLKKDQQIADFRVANLYSDAAGQVLGAKFIHSSGSPVFVFQIETVPQAFLWINEPSSSNQGLAHSLEHLVVGKGIKGRYAGLLTQMKLGDDGAFTDVDFNAYHFFANGTTDDLLEELHAWMDALFNPDFTDVEAEQEFYNFGVSADPKSGKKALIEKGTVYNEMNAQPGLDTYYYELMRRVGGDRNPFSFASGGVPDTMRGVTPQEIRQFHAKYYSLGPQTSLILALAPSNDLSSFLRKVSDELKQFPAKPAALAETSPGQPKYPIVPSTSTEVGIYPFPAKSRTEVGQIFLGWKIQKAHSMVDERLLELLANALGAGEQSLLYKALVDRKTRVLDSGATGVDSWVSGQNSPLYPLVAEWISGIPGNQITPQLVERLRTQVTKTIQEVSSYPARSKELEAFNRLVSSHEHAARRYESIWIRNAPGFGLRQTSAAWKRLLDDLETDPSFNRSLAEDKTFSAIEEQLNSGENIWTRLIQEFHLLETPYATASVPSPELQEQIESKKQERLAAKTKALMQLYNTSDEQQALALFEKDELVKTQQVETIGNKVRSPKLTDHPPLTLDDDIHYQQASLSGVPVTATLFERPPTIDIGLCFDLRNLPRKYYKYLPLLPRFLDGVGLKEGTQTLSYAEVLEQTQRDIYNLSFSYESNALSRRADFAIRASAANSAEFRIALRWIERLLKFNDLNLENADRLRDIVEQAVSADDEYTKQPEEYWITNPPTAFRYQADSLFLALNSHFTQAHWHSRMKWLLHKPVAADDLSKLEAFSNQALLPLDKLSRKDLEQKLGELNRTGLEGELVDYWKKNLSAFADAEMVSGLRQLSEEVQQDLKTGPRQTIDDLKELQRLVINRAGVHLNLTLSPATLEELRPDLLSFLGRIPAEKHGSDAASDNGSLISFILARLQQRYPAFQKTFPYYVGLVNLDGTSGNTIFSASFPGYADLDRRSLLQSLSSELRGGGGPKSLFMKTWEAGLAYSNGIRSYPDSKLIRYYAERSPDIPALLRLVNSLSSNTADVNDQSLTSYVLSSVFSASRSMLTFSDRGRAIAADLRDGRQPDQIRSYSEAILKLSRDSDLPAELTSDEPKTVERVLLDPAFQEKQRDTQSIFFMIGPENILAEAETQLSIQLLRLWPSDYWMQ